MPRISYSPIALQDLIRLGNILKTKNPETAKRAVKTISVAIEAIKNQPDRFRPVPEMVNFREVIIDFGASGYIARYYKKSDDEIIIVRIKHQLEVDFDFDVVE
jgi:plasmid stabilization system protein ParE